MAKTIDPPDSPAQEARARAPFSLGFRILIGMSPGRYRPRKPVFFPKEDVFAPPYRSARAKLTREQETELANLLEWKR